MNFGRKRKPTSPLRPAHESKRPAKAALQNPVSKPTPYALDSELRVAVSNGCNILKLKMCLQPVAQSKAGISSGDSSQRAAAATSGAISTLVKSCCCQLRCIHCPQPNPGLDTPSAAGGLQACDASYACAVGQPVEESWEHISEARSWTPEDCLNHKVAVKKREKEQVVKETFQQHIKSLRALGRHLLTLKEKYGSPCTS